MRYIICCLLSDQQLIAQAKTVAQELHCPFSNQLVQQADFALELNHEGWQLHDLAQPRFQPLRIDFLAGKYAWRRRQQHSELLARACRCKNIYRPLYIIDATAGLGRDALVMASAGHQVLMLEKSPLIALLLADALTRLKEVEPEVGLQLLQANAIDYLSAKLVQKPDIIYLDPMYVEKQKSALVKKDLQFLQHLLRDDENDNEKLFILAMQAAQEKVIVKRALHAPYLLDQKPTYQLSGKHTRFDVYASCG